MKKVLSIILEILRGFLINPFWKSYQIIIAVGLSLAINGFLWYIYELRIKVNLVPFFFATTIVILNLILGNYLYPREKLASFFLIFTGLFIQILMLIYLRYLLLVY